MFINRKFILGVLMISGVVRSNPQCDNPEFRSRFTQACARLDNQREWRQAPGRIINL
jgi:hypothetical protein